MPDGFVQTFAPGHLIRHDGKIADLRTQILALIPFGGMIEAEAGTFTLAEQS